MNIFSYVVTQDTNGQWQVIRMEIHKAIKAVQDGSAVAHFRDLLEASAYAETFRVRDGQTSRRVL